MSVSLRQPGCHGRVLLDPWLCVLGFHQVCYYRRYLSLILIIYENKKFFQIIHKQEGRISLSAKRVILLYLAFYPKLFMEQSRHFNLFFRFSEKTIGQLLEVWNYEPKEKREKYSLILTEYLSLKIEIELFSNGICVTPGISSCIKYIS